MPSLSPQTILDALPAGSQSLIVGYSGGIDSHVLLHLCAQHPALRQRLTAVYIHHGLQQQADDWAQHCQQQAQQLAVPFQVMHINAHPQPGESPEAAARSARYAAFKQLLPAQGVLLVAQHREDQMETLLLQLLRGAGVQGLAAMPQCAAFASGWLLRPLLDTAKAEIVAYAEQQRLHWVEDPSNQQLDYDRNYLRHHIVPLLKQRWPAVDKTIARSASHCAEAQALIDASLAHVAAEAIDPVDKRLLLARCHSLSPAQRRALLRHWLQQHGAKPPRQALLQAMDKRLLALATDSQAHWQIGDYRVMHYRQALYCFPNRYFIPETSTRLWPPATSSLALANGYQLRLIPADHGIPQTLWQTSTVTLQPRQGGETLQLSGRSGHHVLKKLYQEASIPPWERSLRPLIYLDNRLAAVAGLWLADWVKGEGACVNVAWVAS